MLSMYLANAARAHPDKVAVKHKKLLTTYKELDETSNQLANTLIHNGVKSGDRVGIYLTKSIKAVTAIYATLKAGAVYVPLDPIAPVERIKHILADCQIRCLITEPDKFTHFIEHNPDTYDVALTILTQEIEAASSSLPASFDKAVLSWQHVLTESPAQISTKSSPINANDLAYILYTSGSTGVPKGVMHSHNSGMAFIDWAHDLFSLSSHDCIASQAPFHFDLSTFDIFATAKAGATLVLASEVQQSIGATFIRFIVNNQITVLYSVPTVLKRLLSAPNTAMLDDSSVRLLLFAGEVFPIKHLRHLCALLPQVEFYNLYGPTETNVCTWYKVVESDLKPERTQPVSIGLPCTYASSYVVGEQGQVFNPPTGLPEGELCIGGQSLMLGYWGDSVKTEASFIDCIDSRNISEKTYRTGDIVRKESDGNFTFIGRRDRMVKSRGYRIELGEIEETLLAHQDVSGVAVVALPDEEIGTQIQTCLTLKEPGVVTEESLRKYCLEHLPRYMVPEQIKIIEAMPQTSTGKVDYQAIARSMTASKLH